MVRMKEREWNEQSRGHLTFHVLGHFHFLEFVIVECDHEERYVVTGIGKSLGYSSIEDHLNNGIYSVKIIIILIELKKWLIELKKKWNE